MTKSFSLKKEFPDFVIELKTLLAKHPNLQKQMDDLEAVERCRCGSSDCSTIYISPPLKGAWGKGLENFMLAPKKGMIILDVLKGKIVSIETLNRNDIYKKLIKLMPEKTDNEQLTTNN